MAYDPLSPLEQDPRIFAGRVRYAAFLYDGWKDDIGRSKAILRAAREAGIAPGALRQYLPAYNRQQRILRNFNILKMRSWGYSVDLIAQSYDLNRATVARVLDDFRDRISSANQCRKYKIRGRLKLGDPRLETLPVKLF